jgi:calcium binding protein
MRNIEDIPEIPDREKRLDEIMVDCYGREEELAAFEVYLTDALRPPFAATWRDPDESGHAEPITVLGVADVDDRRGILLNVRRRRGGKEWRVLAEQVWADDATGANGIVLDDYRSWADGGGLDEDDEYY